MFRKLTVVTSALSSLEIEERLSLIKHLEDAEHIKRLDLMQKAKIKWAIEGDENSKYFHGIINNKFARFRINGIYIDGVWVTNPPQVTDSIFNFHKVKFQGTSFNRPHFTSNLFKKLSRDEVSILDAPFTTAEIKNAVWDCGGGKAPGPDGFTFKFIKQYWDTIGKDFTEIAYKFEADGYIPRGCNSSFIALAPKNPDPLHIKDYRPISLIGCQYKIIAKVLANRLQQVVHSVVSEVQTAYIRGRQIIDGPLMVNEIISWATKHKERFFLLKVDFEKAFDSIDWNFLDHTMMQMGFSQKWRTWIKGCLNSAYASVLVNGSPTKEFKIERGLRQGDPLSPFLFIIAIEALHVTLQEAKSKNIFEGIKVGSNKVDISHLQYADDALIMGKWSLENATNLCRILRCFHLASGLKVNFSKSRFFGIGVTTSESHHMASILCFQPSMLPCSFLGLPIGANMNKASSWKPIIEKFHKRLSSWKARTLSYGGRLTLIKSVLGALSTYYFSLFKAPKCVINYLEKLRRNFFWGGLIDRNKMAWVSWKKVCSSSNCGGLGIGSLQAANLAMLSKWWWRFHNENNALWKQIITSVHGTNGGISVDSLSNHRLPHSPWVPITKINSSLSTMDVNLHSLFTRVIGDGSTVSFWNDLWIGDSKLSSMFPRIFSLETSKECTVHDRCNNNHGPKNVDVVASPDSWECNLDLSKTFTVSALRKKIDSCILGSTGDPTRWNKALPIKINIHIWRLIQDRLPTRCNLDNQGIDIHYKRCLMCDEDLETTQHLFVDCFLAKSLWKKISSWWGFSDYPKLLLDLIAWGDSTNLSKRHPWAVEKTMTFERWPFRG
ncbi:putative RNA-directed DNA polymerase [Tanacetum coccineum]